MQRFAVYLFLLLFVLAAFSRCAQVVAPTGGPKDTLPPVLTGATPPDSTLRFDAKNIYLHFNEYVQLQGLQDQLIITPYPRRQPVITSKLQTVTIEWKDTLHPNTTYTVNFGNAVQDINEGNPVKDLKYVFSTGNYLDSLQITGILHDAFTGEPDSTSVVMLYTDTADSVVSREKPVYYTRSTTGGRFLLSNLPHGTFKLFALRDANNDLQYTDSTEAIAFLEEPVKLDSNLEQLDLYLFTEKAAVPPPDTSGAAQKDTLTYQVVLNEGKQDLHLPLDIRFSRPLRSFDSTRIGLQEDTLLTPVHPRFQLDSAGKLLHLAYRWKEAMPYRLLLQAGFATDTGGLSPAQADTLAFTTKSESDYAGITLHFTGFDTLQHYVVQLIQNDDIIAAAPLTGPVWKHENLQPGNYTARILVDRNNNGVWDRGSYFGVKRQPEIVIPLHQQFNLRANWVNDFTDIKWINP